MPIKRKIKNINFSTPSVFSDAYNGYCEVFPNATKGLSVSGNRLKNIKLRQYTNICPFCGTDFIDSKHDVWKGMVPGARHMIICKACGWWSFTQGEMISNTIHMTPYVKNFDTQINICSMTELIKESRKSPSVLYSTSPRDFEIFVGSVLKEHFDCNVYHVGGRGDGGIDLIVIDGEKPLLVQVKRRISDRAIEGIDIVKHMFASIFEQKQNKGMVVTTAQHFTKGAKDFVRSSSLVDANFHIELKNIHNLLDMVRSQKEAENFTCDNAMDLYSKYGFNYWVPLHDYYDNEDKYNFTVTEQGAYFEDLSNDTFYFDKFTKDKCWNCSSIFGDTNLETIQKKENELSVIEMLDLLADMPDKVVDTIVQMWGKQFDQELIELNNGVDE